MTSRKPAIIACVFLAVAIAGLGFAWLWVRWDTEWLRQDSETTPTMTGEDVFMVVRVDDLQPDDDRLAAIRTAAALSFPRSLGTIQEGETSSRTWPRAYTWYTMWIGIGDFNDAFVVEYRKRLAEELLLRNLDVRWQVGFVRHDGKVLYAD